MTPKQQRFVEEYLIDLNATAAARRAGYTHPNTQGPRLLVNVGVKAAIAQLQAEHRERCAVTKDSITEMLREDRAFARQCNQSGPAVTASVAIARLHGLVIDKSAVTTSNVTATERAERIAELTERLGLARRPGGTNGKDKPQAVAPLSPQPPAKRGQARQD